MRKHLHLDYSGIKRDKSGMKPFDKEIIPGFETVKGLNMIDASALRKPVDLPEAAVVGGD